MDHDVDASQKDPGAVEDDDLHRRMQSILDNSELVNVRVTACSAKLVQPHVQQAGGAEVSVEKEFFVSAGVMANRFKYEVSVADVDQDELAEIKFDIVIDYDVTDGFEPDEEAAGEIAASTGHFAAFPYAREITESMSARLQLDPLVLGMLRRGTEGPGTVTAVVKRISPGQVREDA